MMLSWTRALALASVLPVAALAQTRVDPPLASFEQAYAAEVSYAARSAIHEGSDRLGRIDTLQHRLAYLGTVRSTGTLSWLVGADWQRYSFSAPDRSPIPDSLQSAALKLGVNWAIDAKWALRVEVDPGLYSDFEEIDGDDFNAPTGLRLTYAASTNVLWVIGLNIDPLSDWPVIGGPGVRWRFAEQWQLNLLLPRPRLEFSPSRHLTLHAGAELKGGSYRLGEDFGSSTGRAQLNGEMVSYREIRAGVGARYRLVPGFAAGIEAGWMIDRRFRFPDEDLQLNGDGAPYVQLSVLGTL